MDETLEDADFQRQAEFRYAIRRFSRFSEDQAREAGITPQQHLLLLTVRGHQHYPQVTIKDVAERLQVRHHSASLLIDRSIARGLLVKSEDAADKRKAIVTLTPEGQSLLDQITRANRRVLRMLDEALFGLRDSLVEAFGEQNHAVTNMRTSRDAMSAADPACASSSPTNRAESRAGHSLA